MSSIRAEFADLGLTEEKLQLLEKLEEEGKLTLSSDNQCPPDNPVCCKIGYKKFCIDSEWTCTEQLGGDLC